MLHEAVAWAKGVEQRNDLTVKVDRLDVYGSYWGEGSDVGDLDIIVVFNILRLAEENLLQPEHMDEQDALLEELTTISQYISPADELDKLNMPSADFRTVYYRHNPSAAIPVQL